MAKHKITTPNYRAKLANSKHPYFVKTSTGRSIGYLKTVKGEKWLARMFKDGKYITQEIGDATNMGYDEALENAVKFFGDAATSDMEYTIADALADYIKHLETAKSAKVAAQAMARMNNHLSSRMRSTKLTKLTKLNMTKWRDGLVASDRPEDMTEEKWENKKRQSKDTANRTMSQFKACLNLAFDNELVSTDRAWKTVKSFQDVTAGRPLLLTADQISKLVENADGQLKNLILAGIYTGGRYGELISAKVSDFDAKKGKLTLSSRKGKGGSIRSRDVILPPTVVSFFKRLTKDSLPSAWLLVKDDGTPWKTGQQRRSIENLVRKAKAPANTVFYSLRHYHISRCMNDGVPILTIAKNCGTSVMMIERTYGKIEDEAARDAFAGVALL